ncbi:hypothetical protein ACWGDX_02980 [Streptomyces sp. NPDC055025]
MESLVRDAAAPIAQALTAVYDLKGRRWPIRDIAISYTHNGVLLNVSPTNPVREQVEDEFRSAFRTAGWGFHTRSSDGQLTFDHPTDLTRL